MNTRAILFLLLVAALGGAFWFSAQVSAKEKTPAVASANVVINKTGIVIPGTTLSKADQDAMNKILNQYDKTLYRIDTYENGKRKKTQGTLTDVVTDKRLASEMATTVKKEGFTQYAVQIRPGVATNPTGTSPVPGASTNPTGTSPVPGATTNPTSSNSSKPKTNDLVERLKPIFKKYQKK
ncbi:MAG: hypothetical protein DLM73_02450 [Chthoniobacterales bacterium]|nr:MAG: hypothetical protein DLM73_02450 [Chthoniobacterales bacterium]